MREELRGKSECGRISEESAAGPLLQCGLAHSRATSVGCNRRAAPREGRAAEKDPGLGDGRKHGSPGEESQLGMGVDTRDSGAWD